MMTKVTIVGGGLSGVLAAFEAHRQGFREIELHDGSGRIGGRASPKIDHGLELRETTVSFGGTDDPIRALLQDHGVAFEVSEARCGSVSPSASGGHVFVQGFDGPALPSRGLALAEPQGDTLADRIRAYPAEMQPALSRYAQWRLGGWIDEAHADAASVMSMGRIYPIGSDVSTLDDLRRTDGLYNSLYALPTSVSGRAIPHALPRDGFAALFETCRRRLDAIGVAVHDASLVSPHQALAACDADEVVVWTADPANLYRAVGLPALKPQPKSARRLRATYVFKAEFDSPRPFHIHNFTATGVVSGIFIYESRGQTLLTAECVAEAPDDELRRELQRLTAGFGGEGLRLGDQMAVSVRSVTLPSVAGAQRMAELRRALERRTNGGLILVDDACGLRPAFDACARDLVQARATAEAAVHAPLAMSA